MDHIPFSSDLPHSRWPLLVPPQVEVSLTLAELEEFPYESGWDADAFLNQDFSPRAHGRSAHEIAKFVQLWLYFGVLSAGLEVPIKVADFYVDGEEGPNLSTKHLHKLIYQFLLRGQHLSKEKKDNMRINLAESIGLLSRLLPGLSEAGPIASVVYSHLEYTLGVLGCTLRFAVPQMFNRQALGSDFREGTIWLWGDQWPIPSLLEQLFAARSWCPSDLPRLNKLVSLNALTYAATLQRNEAIRHDQCTEEGCAINTIDEATYTTQHRTPDCTCKLVRDTGGRACQVLADGTYPLIDLDAFSESSVGVEVVPYRSGMRYTAISHVWSDGLGNTKENSIATCQLQHMKSLLGSVANTKLIWMDTLCVPLDPKYRKEAIVRMTQTYEQAAQVLLFDSELKRVTHKDKPVFEAFARVSISGWMRRVWTLQEGVLAQKLYAEFRDGVMNVSAAANAFNAATNAKVFELDMVPVEFMSLVGMLGGIRQMRDKESEYFINVWNAIRLRRTTRRGDEILCFASMLHLPLISIVEAVGYEEKMKACLSMLKFVPAGLLWTPGRKLQIDGYRWAPYSFLQEEPVDRTWSTSKRDETGLRTLNSTIFLNHSDGFAFSETAFYEDQKDLILRVRIGQSWGCDEILTALADKELAILTDKDISEAFYNGDYMVRGILISIVDWEGEWGPHCRYECAVTWGTIPRNLVKEELNGKCNRSKRAIKWHLA